MILSGECIAKCFVNQPEFSQFFRKLCGILIRLPYMMPWKV